MKRFLKVLSAIVSLLILAIGGLVAATFMGRRGVTDGQDVHGARIVADGFSSLAIVPVGEREVLLVDAGQDTGGEAVLAELSRRGLSVDAVAAIFLTHGHADHTGAIKLFPKAQVMALEAEVPVVEGRQGTRGPLTRLFPVSPTGVTVTRPLRDGETVAIGDVSVRVFAVPGHTVGSAAYLMNQVLFVGDSADVASDGEIQGAPWIFSDNQGENRASLRRMVQRLQQEGAAVQAIVPAHSGPVEGLAPLTAFAQSN